jgi:hypothetical protein
MKDALAGQIVNHAAGNLEQEITLTVLPARLTSLTLIE